MHAEGVTQAGPGHYLTNHVNHLNREPRVTIGNTKRKLGGNEPLGEPRHYTGHTLMTDRRSVSAERNCAKATIGNHGLLKREEA